MDIHKPGEETVELGSGATRSGAHDQSRKMGALDGFDTSGMVAEFGEDHLNGQVLTEDEPAFDIGTLVPDSVDPEWDILLQVVGPPTQPPPELEPDRGSNSSLVRGQRLSLSL